jgi:hypothetical protein
MQQLDVQLNKMWAETKRRPRGYGQFVHTLEDQREEENPVIKDYLITQNWHKMNSCKKCNSSLVL